MDKAFNLLLVILVGGVSMDAFFAALALLLPKPISLVQRQLEAAGGRSLLLGLVNFIFFGLLATLGIWLSEKTGGVLAGISVFLSLIIALGILVLTLVGLVALANLLGARLGVEAPPFATTARGGGLLLLAMLAPYVGWFLFTPLAVWAGLGAAISVLVRKREPSPPVE